MRIRSLRPSHVAALAAMALLAASPIPLARPSDERSGSSSRQRYRDARPRADQGIPQHILERAEAIVVIPSLVKGGFIIGAQHGRGVMSVRDRDANTWSAPDSWRDRGSMAGRSVCRPVDLVLL
jgi:lipid-binding SYLF domain-containing protein